ncbi:hypothetical protein [Succinimonas sp.]|uniref:hypothetical protein n=1 Tax=Succinimonas sp. TaxID=1936151 RepID=UPI003865A434
MKEEGKRIAGEYLLCAIAGFIRDSLPGVHYGAYSWDIDVVYYGEKSVGEGIRQDAATLATFLEEHQNAAVIIISDGNFSDRDCKVLSGLTNMERIRAVMVGADANCPRLQKIFGRTQVFESTDAIECTRQLLTMTEPM